MCGFVGLLAADPGATPDPAALRSWSATLQHRGPDDGREWTAPGAAIGFRRLSIIDLAAGWQPFVLEEEGVAAVCNGEIYNWREVRAELERDGARFRTGSDCEVLPHLFLRHGERLAERLVGMFAFAVVDLRGPAPKLLLGRDRLGIKPLYHAATPDGVLFGSEPKALLASDALPRALRPEALLDYLVQGYCGGENAAWEGMRRVPPGSTVAYDAGAGAAPRTRRYWDAPTDGEAAPIGRDDLLELVDRVVRDRMLADVPLGAFLSGGVDSTAVVDSMARQSADPVIACSVGFVEKSHDELGTAVETACLLGLDHHAERLDPDPAPVLDVLPWHFDEPHADPSTLPTWLVSGAARRHVTVALSGDGGDEVFAGYRRYVHDVAENRLRGLVGAPGRALAGALGSRWPPLPNAPRFLRGRTFLTNLADDPARAYFRSVTQLGRDEALDLLAPDVAARLRAHDPFETFAAWYERPRGAPPLYRAQYADLHTYLPDQILAKVDRASMAVSLEARVPLLDHRLVERCAPLPTREKVRGGRGKHVFREALRGRVRGEVLDGAKRGFDTPLACWLRGPLKPALDDALAALPREWFRGDRLSQIAGEHAAGRRDHARLLWSLLVLERWRRRHAVTGLAA